MSALDQALGIQQSARTSAAETMLHDPLAGEVASQYRASQQDRDAAMEEVKANLAERNAVLRQPLPARPKVPEYAPLPKPPTQAEVAATSGIDPKEFGNPLRAMGQFLPVLATLAAFTTRQPAVNALNAATAAMNAAKANDTAAVEKANVTFKQNLDLAIKTNAQLTEQYKLAMDDRKMTMDERLAKVQGLAASNQDELVLSQLRNGGIDQLYKLWEMRDKSSAALVDLTNHIEGQNLERTKVAASIENMSIEQQQGWARLQIEKENANTNAANVSMTDAIGPVLRKLANSPRGFADLTVGERRALSEYRAAHESNSNPFGGLSPGGYSAAPAAGGVTPGGAVEPRAPAQVTGQKPAAVVTAPPPFASRVVGKSYPTPKGPMTWTGDGWQPTK